MIVGYPLGLNAKSDLAVYLRFTRLSDWCHTGLYALEALLHSRPVLIGAMQVIARYIHVHVQHPCQAMGVQDGKHALQVLPGTFAGKKDIVQLQQRLLVRLQYKAWNLVLWVLESPAYVGRRCCCRRGVQFRIPSPEVLL